MLLLFDIDLTLIETSGAGAAALIAAGKRVFALPSFHDEGVQYAGRLDSVIIADMLRANGLEASAHNIGLLSEEYQDEISRRLATPEAKQRCRALPGVRTLLNAISLQQIDTLGLLTGNYERSGRAKLAACGLDAESFVVRVWAGCAPVQPAKREDLPGVGLSRAQALLGKPLIGRDAVIIGDTVHDVRAARAHDCWCMGVLTGGATGQELLDAGADAVVANLADTSRVLRTFEQWRNARTTQAYIAAT